MAKSVNTNGKIKKKKGPFRTGAVAPFFIVLALAALFNILFLDSILKRSFEYVAASLNGAQVDVGELSTSFSKLELNIKEIQFTDKGQPDRNLFVIGRLRFQALWDALLRAKFVVNEIKVGGVKIRVPRKSPGKVLSSAQDAGLKGKILEKTKEEFEGNILADIASLLQGKEIGALKDEVKGELDSEKEIEKAFVAVELQEKKLEKLYGDLPSEKELQVLQRRFEQINWSDLSNIGKASKTLKEVDQIKKDADQALKKYAAVSKEVNQSVKAVERAKSSIDQAVKTDIQNLQKRLNIPSLDSSSIAKKLFGEELFGKFSQLELYKDKAKKYMPPKREKKEKPSFVSPPRDLGRDYQFTQKNSYPLYWVKKISIDSQTEQGKVIGEVLDVSSEQVLTGKPLTASFTGDFPPVGVRDVSINASLDHRDEKIKDAFSMTVGRYQVLNKNLAQSESVKFAIKKALASGNLQADYDGDKVNLSIKNIFKNVEFDNAAESKEMLAVLDGISQTTSQITLDASAQGTPGSLKWNVKSNLGQALQNSLKARLQAKVTAAQNQIRANVEKEIGPKKKELEGKIAKLKSQATKTLEEGKQKLQEFNNKVEDQKKKAQEKAQEKAKKDVLKDLGF